MSHTEKAQGNNLKRYRLMFGYSQREIARKLGIHTTTIIGRWEQGLAYPDLKNLIKLSVIYKTLIDQLYSDLRKSIIKELDQNDNKKLNDISSP